MRFRRRPQGPAREDGYVLVTTAALLLVFCGFAALAVDVSLLLGARASAQRAADAGALAGAFTFVVNPPDLQPGVATSRAIAVTTTNSVLDQPLLAPEVQVTVDVAQRLVTVDVNHPVSTFFARALGLLPGVDFDTVNVRGYAMAEASPTATAAACTKPWFIPNTMLSLLPPCDACAAGELIVANGQLTPWAQSRLGQLFPIRPNNPADALAPGQFYSVRLGDSTGGNDYRNNIIYCTDQIVGCQQSYGVEPGAMIGPTLQGVRGLVGENPDSFLGIGRYQRPDGTVSDTSHQLVVAPIWDSCGMAGFCPAAQLPANGANVQIPVVGFSQVFVEGVAGSNVVAYLVGATACSGGGGGGPAPGEIGPYSLPVRLVRLP